MIYATAVTRTIDVLVCSLCHAALLDDDETCSGCGANIVEVPMWRPAEVVAKTNRP